MVRARRGAPGVEEDVLPTARCYGMGIPTDSPLESYLAAADITLSTEVLDRIDELVAPVVTLNPDINSYGAHELAVGARRR